tara:strand:- start:327 stop:830 length:504 start_codon:yes stop_codon:yes gene_type:complete
MKRDLYKIRKINFGWYKRRHGILLENLPPLKQLLILDNNYFRFLSDDVQALEVIFRIEDLNDHEKNLKKVYWNSFRENFTTLKEIEQDAGYLDWFCAICSVDIKTKMAYKKVENFVCHKCSKVHNSKNKSIDQRIVNSSTKFVRYAKKMLKGEQKEFLSYAKKSAKS